MRKILFLLFLVKFAYGQEPAYNYMRNNYSIRGVRVDSLFLFPKYSDTTATHIIGSVIRIGNKFYFRDTTKWVAFGQSGIDTTSLSNRINSKADTSLLIGVLYRTDTTTLLATKSQITSLQNSLNTKIDSLKKKSDSIYFKKNGVWYFVYKDSVGSFDSTSLSNRINQKLNTSDTSAMLSSYLRKVDTASLSNRINLKVNISDTSAMLSRYLRKVDTVSLSNRINLKVNISDTNSMLSPYLRKSDTSSLSNRINLKVNISDTGSMLSPYLKKIDTASLSSRINLKLNISDTSSMLNTYLRKIDTASLSNRINKKIDSLYRSSTNVYYVKNGVSTLAYTDSVGMAQNGRFGSDTATIVMAKVHNDAGVQLTNGKVVYLSSSGTSSDVPSVKLANNKGDSSSANTFGFVSGTIAVNDTGWIILSGKIEKLNTSAFSNGDIIYLDSVSGQWTKNKPSAPYHQVYLGAVIKANSGNGSIFVKCQNGYELSEIHDCLINGKVNNQILIYSDTQKVWKNRSVYSIVDTTQLSARIDQRVKYSDTASMLTNYAKSSNVVKYTDTATMLSPYVHYTDTSSMLSNYAKTILVNTKLNISDTSAMLSRYLRKSDTTTLSTRIDARVKYTDTSSMLSTYLRKADTSTLSSRINLKLNISDTAAMLSNYSKTSTVNTKVNISDTSAMLSNYFKTANYDFVMNQGYAALGSTMKGINLGVPFPMIASTTAGSSSTGRAQFTAIYIPTTTTITGAKFVSSGTANQTGYNGIALYSYSAGTLTRVAISKNDTTIFEAGSVSLLSKAFDSSGAYIASPGIYYVATLTNYSSGSITMTQGYQTTAAFQNTWDFTNSARLGAWRLSVLTFATSYTMATMGGTQNPVPMIYLY